MRIKILQNIINRIRGKVFALGSVVNKYECAQRAKDFHTLALGSSHMEYGYIPLKGEINMGSSSQDLYYSYNLYKLLNSANLKKILLTFSVFSPGDFLIKSDLNKICVLFKILYGIPYQDEEFAKKNNLKNCEDFCFKQIIKYRKKINIPEDYNGYLFSYANKGVSKNLEKIEKRAKAHYKINRKQKKNMEYCLKLLEETKKNSQKIYFILPPATEYYKAVLPLSNVIFEDLYKVCENYPHVKIINLYDSDEFSNDNFVDGDHLNGEGCRKFTDIVRQEIA